MNKNESLIENEVKIESSVNINNLSFENAKENEDKHLSAKNEDDYMIDELRKRLHSRKKNLENQMTVEKVINRECIIEESNVDLVNFNWKRKKI
jgi:hypothetical protein